jgi:hypothetical protein
VVCPRTENESCKAKGREGVFKGLLVVEEAGNKRKSERFTYIRDVGREMPKVRLVGLRVAKNVRNLRELLKSV